MKKCIILFLFQVLFCFEGLCFIPHYYFKQLSLKDGLSQSTVNCVRIDNKGFIWIGTHFGLNRFDRERIVTYYQDKNDPFSIPGNDIIFITEDARSNIWVGTESGLALYNPVKDNFTRATFQNHPLSVNSTLLMEDGVLFFGVNEVFKYSYSDRKISAMPVRNKEKMNSYVNDAFLYDKKNEVALLSTRWDGVWLYRISDGNLERLPFIRQKEITSTCLTADGHVWISPYGEGVYCYDRKGQLLQHLSAPEVLNNGVVLDCVEKKGELWMATDGGGISIYDLKTGFIRSIEHVPGNVNSLPVNSFWCLYNDDENNMWAGSIRGGLIGLKETYMNTYRDVVPGSDNGLSNRTVTSMYEDEKHKIWLGTDGGGINYFDPVDEVFKHFPLTYTKKIVSIIGNEHQDELILSLFSQGLYRFNKKSGQLSEYKVIEDSKYRKMFRTGKSVHLLRLDSDRFYLFADSVYLYNQANGLLEKANCRDSNVIQSSLQSVYAGEGNSYLCGPTNLIELDYKSNTMRVVYRADEITGALYAACRNNQGELWIGSSAGLFRLDSKTNVLESVKTGGITGITSLTFDRSGHLWVGTHNGLFSYMPEYRRIVIFGESDGVFANEYLTKPPLVTSFGDIYMAGVSGLVHIPGRLPFVKDSDPAIHLLDVILDGESVGLGMSGSKNKISIPWNYTSLSAKVIVKESDLMRKKMYRYYIKGNLEKVIESSLHSITFHSLAPGNYQLYVSCNKKNGEWSNPVKLLSVTITPPWWKTVWFFLLVIGSLFSVLAFTAWRIVRNKERKMAWKIKENERNTYEEKVRFLINISHELRTPLTLVYAPLKRLLTSGELKDESLSVQLTAIFRQTRRIRDIVNMVLDVRKMEIGSDTLNIRKYHLNSWIQEIADGFKPELRARSIELLYDFDPAINEIPFDAAKCEVILSNLLINALKFSEQDTYIQISSMLQNEYVRISVKDHGIGLGNVDISRLFTRFYQGNHGQKGNGIGLSYSRLLAEMHGGRINASNNADKGATFYFELPLTGKKEVQIEARPYINELLAAPEEEQVVATDFSIQKYTLLIAEDEPELRNYLKNALSEFFHQVYAAANGLEALELVSRYHPDLIVSDVMMPRMDGFEFCHQVKTTLEISHIPVVLLTARTDTESAVQGYKLGADLFIPKPFDLDFLIAVLRSLLRSREAVKVRYKDATKVVSPKDDTISNADEQFMRKLTSLIEDNLANPDLDVSFIAEKMAMSRASLYNKLKELADISIGDYVNKLRMAKAIRLLADKNLSIQEISERCGFSQQRYFSTVFKQSFGVTPTRYRQENFI